jgi:hypothetical protein
MPHRGLKWVRTKTFLHRGLPTGCFDLVKVAGVNINAAPKEPANLCNTLSALRLGIAQALGVA